VSSAPSGLGRGLAPGETFVKICGITCPEDAEVAVEAGASAVGFVLAPSPRRLDTARAGSIRRLLPASVAAVGVFVDAGLPAVIAAVDALGLDGVQFQGSEPDEEIVALRAERPSVFVTRAVRLATPQAAGALAASPADALMVDSKDGHRPADRHAPLPLAWLAGLPLQRLIVAGGLTPGSVGGVVASLRPWGVDVSSGVEQAPGRKDPALVRAFVRAVRAAEAAPAAVCGATPPAVAGAGQ
jgi:phosphoribosylanthranilate isomerase